MRLTFLGGAESVTGSNYLLQHGTTTLLIDCGLFQGSAEMERLNDDPFPFDVKSITALLITHSHIDHIGRVPLLVKRGYSGPIYSTAPTRDAASELLTDTQGIMMHQLGEGELPLYERTDIEDALELWETISYRVPFTIGDFTIEYFDAGHILGSASIRISAGGKTVTFSGDLGNIPAPLVKDTDYIHETDYALIESAYGGRVHEPVEECKATMERIIKETAIAGGTVIIPAFAMERTQQLLYELNDLFEKGGMPHVPIFIDSPLAIKLTSVFQKYSRDPEYFDQEARTRIAHGDKIFDFPGLRFTLTTNESKEINSVPPPKVVIAGSGMSQGGRILHHEIRYLPDPNSAILFVGFQPEGSLGRQIIDGVQSVTIMGEEVAVRARVTAIGGYSAHADLPLLLKWVGAMKDTVKQVFVVQGEVDQSTTLAEAITKTHGVAARVPKPNESIELI